MHYICVRISILLATLCALFGSAFATEVESFPWKHSPEFGEVSFTVTVEPKIRVHVNAPVGDDGKPARATRLIVYALPNGNTIEQTLGCLMKPGMDFRFDIQHVAAQTRLLRTVFPEEKIVLVCCESPELSWPAFRKKVADANARFAKLVDEWREQFGGPATKVTLTGHSGGGSFKFGLIEASETIPSYIDRIAFLDGNYSFRAELHAKKLETWLNGDKERRLIVVCYDDREITSGGKKVIGPTGGTYRATGRMREAIAKPYALTDSVHDPFQEATGLDGRIHFFIHPNPENRILHTALVGEMNGLVQIATLGTPQENKWGKFGGPRAYAKFIQAEPTPKNADDSKGKSNPAETEIKEPLKSSRMELPPRKRDAIGGAEFAKQIETVNLKDREAAILREIGGGNFPDFLRAFKTVEIRGKLARENDQPEVIATIDVMPDYLAVGSDADFVRMPMTPQTAQQIADQFGCVLSTRKIVDAIDAQAELMLTPHPLSEAREAIATFAEHHRIIERERDGRPLGLLVSGIKKDVVLSSRIFEKTKRVALYGWRKADGQPIQQLTIVHWNGYVDYSHGVRLVRDTLSADGSRKKIAELLADPKQCNLVSDEGPMQPPRYPLDP